MTFTLRSPEPGDAAEIAELHVATWRETYTHLLPDGFFDADHAQGRRDLWERILERPRGDWRIRVAEQDGHLFGFAASGPSSGPPGAAPFPRERQLYMVYVLAGQHGGGAGQALLDAVLADDPAMLWVATDNPRAIAFYRRNGFEFDGVEQADPGAPLITDARMVR